MGANHTTLILCPCILLGGAVMSAANQPRYVPTREIALEYATANHASVTRADLWVSSDATHTWELANEITNDSGTITYVAPSDGRFDFFLVLHNDAGPSSPPPEPGMPPVASVIVDTAPPLVQINHAQTEVSSDGVASLSLNTTLVEENLSPTGIRVFYRATPNDWRDGGPATFAEDHITWTPPPNLNVPADLRIVVTDRAGNHNTAEVLDVDIARRATGAAGEVTQPALPQTPTMIAEFVPVVPPTIDPVQPVIVGPLSQSPAAEQPIPPATPPDREQHVERLRELASSFMQQGQYALALARYTDALEIAPTDADLLVDLGSALYRVGHYDEASLRFTDAATNQPDHVGALNGLALVAATQKRYPQAREYLCRLQRLQPESAHVWLRSGDIEHRLGNTAAALKAWQRVLETAENDADVRQRAQRRLDYFRPLLAPPAEPGRAQPIPAQAPESQTRHGQEARRKSFDDRRARG